jgi:hypothetical protein
MTDVLEGVQRTYRSPALLGLGVTALVLVGGATLWVSLDQFLDGRWLPGAVTLLSGVVLGELTGEVFVRPRVSATPAGVELVNPFRTVLVPWHEIRGVETQLALQIVVDGRKHASFAATGNRQPQGSVIGGIVSRRLTPGGGGSPYGPSPQTRLTAPLECRLFIDEGLAAWRSTRRGDGEDDAPVRITWHQRWLLAFAASVVLLAAASAALIASS